ncbi:hypothetical protein Y1Q_0016657 [Alligator mississippiensis]|uniref:Uncharacterized protein n=1 Tax=Alligator mississippiensis TaxID=8496 RepID=A0A151P1D8_ALLMI|nr:hypothetical protein Y1Q_0016657 [Alligator mississippiensis]
MDLQQSPFTTLGSLGNEAGKAASDDAYSWIYPGFTVQTGLGDESSDLSTACECAHALGQKEGSGNSSDDFSCAHGSKRTLRSSPVLNIKDSCHREMGRIWMRLQKKLVPEVLTLH